MGAIDGRKIVAAAANMTKWQWRKILGGAAVALGGAATFVFATAPAAMVTLPVLGAVKLYTVLGAAGVYVGGWATKSPGAPNPEPPADKP